MARRPYSTISTKRTPQSQPVPGKSQSKNLAGGYVFSISDWERLDRFLILGTEGGTYYTSQQALTQDNATVLLNLLKTDGPRLVSRITQISQEGRAPKNEPAVFALAMCAGLGDAPTKKLALEALPKVARIGTDLFHFISYVEGFRGWGRALRKSISNWYLSKTPESLAYQTIKYQQRDGWSHKDLLVLAHPNPNHSPDVAIYDSTFNWIMTGTYNPERIYPELINGFIDAHKPNISEKDLIQTITRYKLPWEALPTQFLKSPDVWKTLLPHLPLRALIRNLGRFSSLSLTKPMSPEVDTILAKLKDQPYIAKSRLHPLNILVALKTYERGKGEKSKLTWEVNRAIIRSLDKAFYLAFPNVQPTHKRIIFGIDASGSMNSQLITLPLSCREGAVALSLVSSSIEEPNSVLTLGFTQQNHVVPLSTHTSLIDAMRELNRNVIPQGTDCSLPIVYAIKNRIITDAFVILTDNETWAGPIHVHQALDEYRAKVNPNAKIIVVGMTATRSLIGDPDDPGTLSVVGFDTSTPAVISNFINHDHSQTSQSQTSQSDED